MTSFLEHLEDNIEFIKVRDVRDGIFVGQMNGQLSVISIKMEFDIGVPSNKLTQRSGE